MSLQNIIVGINAYHPDSSVAFIKDGILIWAAEEERYSRIKHASGFPAMAIKQGLKDTGVTLQDIAAVAISKNPKANFFKKINFTLSNRPDFKLVANRILAFKKSTLFENDFWQAAGRKDRSPKTRFIHVEHHQAHIASSFFLSGFERAAFLSIDGMGDFSSAMWGWGEGNRLQVYDRVYFPHSAGFLYTAATQFIGFHKFGDEYKVMGLAGYGNPVYREAFRKMIWLLPQGKFELDLNYFVHHKGQANIHWEGGAPEQDILYSHEWVNIFGTPRSPHEPITQREKDIAASLQAVLEEIYFHVLNHLYKKTRSEHLCLAGGVAFNSVANGKITKNTPFKHIYIQPAAGDAGTALGAAVYVNHVIMGRPRNFVMNHAAFGTSSTDDEIRTCLESKNIPYQKIQTDKELVTKAAKAIADGKVVGWFQGKMEFGPRALGNRSILADPRRHDMKDILNQRIKHRETFRPFAPAVLEERAPEFFEMDCASSPFMLKVFPVRPEKRGAIPAITHVDGTARVQTVSKSSDPLFAELLAEFGKLTGIPILLNTSFNENEPIVCFPEEALDCFLKTNMDILVTGRYWTDRTCLEQISGRADQTTRGK